MNRWRNPRSINCIKITKDTKKTNIIIDKMHSVLDEEDESDNEYYEEQLCCKEINIKEDKYSKNIIDIKILRIALTDGKKLNIEMHKVIKYLEYNKNKSQRALTQLNAQLNEV